MILKGESASYKVGPLVAETSTYRLYLCVMEGGGDAKQRLLQVAKTVGDNAALDRAAYLIQRLLHEAERLEAEYARVKKDPKELLNYQFCFPEITDSFVVTEQGGRRVSILKFRGVNDVQEMVPLSNIVHRDRLRVDLRTSVWIMGKLLKILAFAHGVGIEVSNLALGNILIEPMQHYVVVFSWADAQLSPDGVAHSRVREEIQAAARCVIELLGGTPEEGIPDDGTKECTAYAAHLVAIATGGESNAFSAHQAFYALVDSLWPRSYHPFTSRPR